jgi:hypothetical protein
VAPESASQKSESRTSVQPEGFMGIDALARHFKVPGAKREALRKRLERFRKEHAQDSNAFIEHDAKGRNETRYLYNPARLANLISDLT